jgi:hypothetical protein
MMTPAPTSAPPSRSRWLEIAAAIILSLASVITAWSTYQASQWTRTQSATGNQVVASLLESTRLTTLASQDALVDVVTFTSWLEAYSTDNTELADFYRSRFRSEFQPAFEAWAATTPRLNPDAPPSPFAMPEYEVANREAAQAAQDRAAALQLQVREAADYASYYIRNTIFMASALFFVGISRTFPEGRLRMALVIVALGLLVFGGLNILTGPVA